MPAATASPRYDRTAAAIIDAAARVLADRGASANMANVAAASGVSRATLYRYFPSREALLEALAAQALTDAGSRIADAGLDRCPVPEAIERIVRALLAVGDRYAVLLSAQVEPDPGRGRARGRRSPSGRLRPRARPGSPARRSPVRDPVRAVRRPDRHRRQARR